IVRGRKNGTVTVRPASAAKTPLCVTWSRKVGPLPASGPPDSLTATASRAGMAASTTSSALTRRRRNWVASSARHIESLAGEGDKRVLQTGPDGDQTANAHARLDQGPAAILGPVAVQPGADGDAVQGDVAQAESRQHRRCRAHLLRLHLKAGGTGRLQLTQCALGEQLAERHDRDVGAHLLDFRQ